MRSFSKILGGHSSRIQAYAAPSLKEPLIIAKESEEFVEQGFKAIKLRLGLGVERDIEIVKAARTAAGDGIQLMIDPNMAYSFRTAVEMGKIFDDYGVLGIGLHVSVYW
jgi:L-alanine-DL-glutamate epimerase-like enolase superfamily enzyme